MRFLASDDGCRLTRVFSPLTHYAAIANPTLPAEGSASFSNVHLGLLIVFVPWIVQKITPLVGNGWKMYYFFLIVLFLPVTVGYWTIMSIIGQRVNEKCILPNKGKEHYMEIKDVALRQKYQGKKIPMQVFHDAYFDAKIDFKGTSITKNGWLLIAQAMSSRPWKPVMIGLLSSSPLK